VKTVILRTLQRTKSNSFSDADRGAIYWSVWQVNNESDKTDNCLVTINYVKKYVIVLQIVNFLFCWQSDKKYYKENC
jgi:hypothetical protein